jgi:hypothetical protein
MSEDLSDFFKLLAQEKKKKKEEFDSLVGDLGLDSLFEDVINIKKENKEKKEREKKTLKAFENFVFSEEIEKSKKPIRKKETKETAAKIIVEKDLQEKSLGLLSEPSDVKQQNDPLTPLNQNFATLEDLQKHYNLFLNRIQQQLSTLGGGGETRLEFLDDVDRDSAKENHKFLRYDSVTKKWVGSDAGEGPFISSTKYVTSSSYTILEHDYYIGVNYPGAVTITLPSGSVEGTTYIVKDERGEASKGMNRYITIFPSGFDLIDGENRVILAYDFGSLTFVYRNGWRVV